MAVHIGFNNPILKTENRTHLAKFQAQREAFSQHYPRILALLNLLGTFFRKMDVDKEWGKKSIDELLTAIYEAETFANDFFQNVDSLQPPPLTFTPIEAALETLRKSPLPESITRFMASTQDLQKIKSARFKEADDLAVRVEKSMKRIHKNFIKMKQKCDLCEPFAPCKNIREVRVKVIQSKVTQGWETTPIGALSCIKFHNVIMQSLHEQNGEEVRRVDALFKEYHSSMTDVNIQLNVLRGLIREKNIKFDTRTTQQERQDLSVFSTSYVQAYWEHLREIYQMQTAAQCFSHLVQGLNFMPFVPTSLGREWFKQVPDKFRERMTFQVIKQLRYHYAWELDKKIQKGAKEQLAQLILVVQELGRYEQTVANKGFPLNFLAHAFSTYHICVYTPPKEQKEACGKRVHNLKRADTVLSRKKEEILQEPLVVDN